jgi:citrate lyase beta subunit
VPIIHEVFSPTEAEVASARQLVDLYESVLAEGKPAALTNDGQTVLVHDYDKALHLLARAG